MTSRRPPRPNAGGGGDLSVASGTSASTDSASRNKSDFDQFVKRQSKRWKEREDRARQDLALINQRLLDLEVGAGQGMPFHTMDMPAGFDGGHDSDNFDDVRRPERDSSTFSEDPWLAEVKYWTDEKERVEFMLQLLQDKRAGKSRKSVASKKSAAQQQKRTPTTSPALTERKSAAAEDEDDNKKGHTENEGQQKPRAAPNDGDPRHQTPGNGAAQKPPKQPTGEDIQDEYLEEATLPPSCIDDAESLGISSIGMASIVSGAKKRAKNGGGDGAQRRGDAEPLLGAVTEEAESGDRQKDKAENAEGGEAPKVQPKERPVKEWCALLRLDEVEEIPNENWLLPDVNDDGLKQLAQAMLRGRAGIVQNLKTLDLSGCKVTNDGIRNLLEETRQTLHRNARSFRRCQLKTINLSNNPSITREVEEELVDIVHMIGSITTFQVDNQDPKVMSLIDAATKARQKVERERAARRKRKEEAKGATRASETKEDLESQSEEKSPPPNEDNGDGFKSEHQQRLRDRGEMLRERKRQLDFDLSILWQFSKEMSLSSERKPMVLTDLNFSGRLMGDDGVETLLTALNVGGGRAVLQSLSLDGNAISAKGARSIANYLFVQEENNELQIGKKLPSPSPPPLKLLQLDWNSIGDVGAIALSKAIHTNDELTELYLGRNDLGDAGASAIAVALWKRRADRRGGGIVDLSLIGNDIGFMGLSTFADCLDPTFGGKSLSTEPPSLERLRLGDNPRIGTEQGGRCLDNLISSIRSNHEITYLSLWRCSIERDAEAELKELETARQADKNKKQLTIFLDHTEPSPSSAESKPQGDSAQENGEEEKEKEDVPPEEKHKPSREEKTEPESSGNEQLQEANETADETPDVSRPPSPPPPVIVFAQDVHDNEWGWGKYEGEVGVTGAPHGKGTFLTVQEDKRYEGEWVHGSRTGWGWATWFREETEYRGHWRDGFFNGRGYHMMKDRQIYEGYFKNGDRHGFGKQENRDGSAYEGEWQNNLRHGQGMLRSGQGKIEYEGNWACNLKEAKRLTTGGRVKRAAGAVGKRFTLRRTTSGQSRSILDTTDNPLDPDDDEESVGDANSSNPPVSVESLRWIDFRWGYGTYRGEIDPKRRPNGQGSFVSDDDNRYQGFFRHGERTGFGEALWKSGASYVGHWSKGRRHGFGENIKSDGAKYAGYWRYNERHGDGEDTSPDGGGCKFGEWRFDKLVRVKKKGGGSIASLPRSLDGGLKTAELEEERVTISHFDTVWGTGIYSGEIDEMGNKQPNGDGEFETRDGRWYDGDWKDGCRDGHGVASWPMIGMEYDGTFKDGHRHGFGSAVWTDGSRFQGEWKDNQRHGEGVYIKTDGSFARGRWKKDELCSPEG